MSEARYVAGLLEDARALLEAGDDRRADDLIEESVRLLNQMADEEDRGQLSSERVAVSCPRNPEPHTLAECLAAEHERMERP